ncbi:ribosome-binding protein 1-like isoform X4 [Polistes fuscatus]|uniref:ribosome-binding protein 1-like isoform X4 n=1 Tax=Polistes fuscatus TaxID=30207 RepID=UPI001CA868C8|nr:ribosome-binding protein 1-like isoform X4 [Polistes fuscatus]
MDMQTTLICIGIVVISAVSILLISLFGMKGKSYEEAIAEQRKLPDDLLLSKKDKSKDKKHKNKSGKKVKEKKEKDEKDGKEEKQEHVQFEETPQILPPELPLQEGNKASKKKGKPEKVKPILVNKDEPLAIASEISSSQHILGETNHFELIQPKDDLELIRNHSKENLSQINQINQSEPMVSKPLKETPTKLKKNVKEPIKKKDENIKEEKKETNVNVNVSPAIANKEVVKEIKDQQKEAVVKEVKEVVKDPVPAVQLPNKESKKTKKKNDILAQIGGDKDAVNVSLLMLFIQKAELSRSEIQIIIEQLLNMQMDNPSEHSEWTEGRADPVIKLKKQLAEKEKALTEEHEASVAFQTKLKELRSEFNAERSRLSANARQLEEALNNKITEAQTLHTRMQHILESHAAEKQGFARQIEQLQTKVNEDAAIIHKMQEDQGQTQGHLQQELINQRKQLEVQFAQMHEAESTLKAQLAQKHVEVQDLQNELQVSCANSTAEIEMLQQQLSIMQGQLMHTEQQLQHFKESSDRLQDVARQLEESHRAHADLDHRLKNSHRHEQDLQKQVNSLQAELNVVKVEANEISSLKSELTKAQTELLKMESELSLSKNEANSEAAEIIALNTALCDIEEELKKCKEELEYVYNDLKKSKEEVKYTESICNDMKKELERLNNDLDKMVGNNAQLKDEAVKYQNESRKLQEELSQLKIMLAKAHEQIKTNNEAASELKVLKAEIQRLQIGEKKSSEIQIQVTRLQEEKDRLSAQLVNFMEMQKEIQKLREENESLASQLTATTERPAADGHENGIEEKLQKNNIELLEHVNLLAQKDSQLDGLRTELTHQEAELNKLNAQVDALKSDMSNKNSLVERLQNDLDAQRSKNNDIAQKIKAEQQEQTKAFLQRVFPEIKVTETSHEQWLNAFENKVYFFINTLKDKTVVEVNPDIEKQNIHLQEMVSHYKKIIDDTEGMLTKLQSHIESEETRWQALLQQKESEVSNLRVELTELQTKLKTNEKFRDKVSELEAKLQDAQFLREQTNAELSVLKVAQKSVANGNMCNHDLAALEKLQEEKTWLSEELQTERNKRATLDASVAKLNALVETSESSLTEEKNLVARLQQEISQLKNEGCGGCSSSEQSMLNGPPTSDSPISEQLNNRISEMQTPLAAQNLIAALESTFLKNTEFANCSMTKSMNLVQSQQEIDNSSLTSKYSSKSCHMTDHNTQASWNPLNGQQHKKHKKKRKGGSRKK